LEKNKMSEEKKEEKKEAKSGVSRRTFIGGTVAGLAVGAAAAYGASQLMAPSKPTVAPPTEEGAAYGKTITLKVNGTSTQIYTKSNWTLLYVLREQLRLTGTKLSCDYGDCGACTVIINGKSALACMTLAIENDGNDILTIEGLSPGGKLHPIQQAFIDNHAYSCGYCIPGMIMSAKALLDKNPSPSEDDVRAGISGNLCRCTGYVGPIRAIMKVGK
jgi:aerobic-type carbon monoxide dehydrogenase small subunit (CoxS/CutS family)